MRYVLVVLLLAGCVGPQQRAQQDIARLAPYCEQLGHKPNTDAWRDCIQLQAAANPATNGQRAVWMLTGK